MRFDLQSSQLEYPIVVPFMPPHHRTRKDLDRTRGSHKKFRLNKMVEVNVIHMDAQQGGKRSEQSEVNLEKHLTHKSSIVRV